MMRGRAQQDDIECIRLLGGRLQGMEVATKSWWQLFSNAQQTRYRLDEIPRIRDAQLFVLILQENLSF